MDNINQTKLFYLPVSERDKAWGMYVIGAGCFGVPAGKRYTTSECQKYSFRWQEGRILQDFALVYITSGSGYFESKHCKNQKIQSGDVFFLFPGEWHTYHPAIKDGWYEYWLIFNGFYPEQLWKNKIISEQNPVFHTGIKSDIYHPFNHILQHIEKREIGYEQIIAGEVTRLLASVLALDRNQPGKRHEIEKKMQEAKLLIEQFQGNSLSIERIADDLCLSCPHFRRLFKEYAGLSPHQYYLQVKVNRAKELLEHERLSVKQVSAQLGFDDEYYFSRLFKKKTGVSPSNWRG